jgi:hypothetical protein
LLTDFRQAPRPPWNNRYFAIAVAALALLRDFMLRRRESGLVVSDNPRPIPELKTRVGIEPTRVLASLSQRGLKPWGKTSYLHQSPHSFNVDFFSLLQIDPLRQSRFDTVLNFVLRKISQG